MKWFCRGDIDGFFALAIDNLIQILLIIGLCMTVLGMPESMIFSRILPGIAISLLLGNLAYAWQAVKLGQKTGKKVCALPYGINTPSVFIYVFLIMLPVKLAAQAQGADPLQAAERAWQAGGGD